MKPRLLSPRSLSLLLAAWMVFMAIIACGAPVATEVPSDSPTSIAIQSTSIPPVIIPATPTAEVLIPVTGGEGPAPALPEFRFLTLEYPPVIKLGSGSDLIILTLDVDEIGNITPTAQFEGNVVEGEVIEIPNLYATHNVTAEAFIQMAGLDIEPPGPTYQPLKQGRPVKFTWTVRAENVGPSFDGVVHLFLNFEDRETKEQDRIEISVQFIEVKVVDFFGFSTNFVKSSGVVGSVLGSIVGFPFFKEIAQYLFDRLVERKKKAIKPKKK